MTRIYEITVEEYWRLMDEAKALLKNKKFSGTKYLRDRLKITGQRAGMIFRDLGWIRYNQDSRTSRYRRPEA